jgi:hypothetical protein
VSCVGLVLHQCSSDGQTDTMKMCGSAAQCDVAVPQCDPCIAGTVSCSGNNLEVCSGTPPTLNETACGAAATCNATVDAGSCVPNPVPEAGPAPEAGPEADGGTDASP